MLQGLLRGVSIAGAGSVVWSPTQLPLRAWYKFNDLSGSNGDPQGSVTDASGNGFTLTQAGGNRPTLAAADLNSLNTIRLTSASSQYYLLANAIYNGLAAGSLYFIYKGVATATNCPVFNGGTSGLDSHYPFSDDNYYNDFGIGIRFGPTTSTSAVTSYRIVSLNMGGTAMTMHIDGGTGGSGGGTSPLLGPGTVAPVFPTTDRALGANAALSAFFNGWIAEVFFTSASQSIDDRQRAEGYLAWKWGLTGNLAATHPYKSVRP